MLSSVLDRHVYIGPVGFLNSFRLRRWYIWPVWFGTSYISVAFDEFLSGHL